MKLLNMISVIFWMLLAYRSFLSFKSLKNAGLSKNEVTAITILLLSGLNICRGLISIFIGVIPISHGQLLLEYFYIGSSIFQLLLSGFILKHIENKQT